MSDGDEVCSIIANQLGVECVTPAMRLIEDLGAESIDFFHVAAAIERRLGVVIPDDALFESETVEDFVSAVDRARQFAAR